MKKCLKCTKMPKVPKVQKSRRQNTEDSRQNNAFNNGGLTTDNLQQATGNVLHATDN
jgi:hypothetical protein